MRGPHRIVPGPRATWTQGRVADNFEKDPTSAKNSLIAGSERIPGRVSTREWLRDLAWVSRRIGKRGSTSTNLRDPAAPALDE
jgi:hypothetical protein